MNPQAGSEASFEYSTWQFFRFLHFQIWFSHTVLRTWMPPKRMRWRSLMKSWPTCLGLLGSANWDFWSFNPPSMEQCVLTWHTSAYITCINLLWLAVFFNFFFALVCPLLWHVHLHMSHAQAKSPICSKGQPNALNLGLNASPVLCLNLPRHVNTTHHFQSAIWVDLNSSADKLLRRLSPSRLTRATWKWWPKANLTQTSRSWDLDDLGPILLASTTIEG